MPQSFSTHWSRYLLVVIVVYFTAGFSGCPPTPQTQIPQVFGSYDSRFYTNGSNNAGSYLPRDVKAIAVDNRTGNIFFGGSFTSIRSESAYNVAYFNPTEDRWYSLSGGGLVDGSNQKGSFVNALAISGKYLYVGGNFSETKEGTTMGLNRIARYDIDLKIWEPLAGEGLDGDVNALVISGNFLIVGGSFSSSNNLSAMDLNNIARYDITQMQWSSLPGDGLNDTVRALISGDNGSFTVGGEFTETFSSPTTGLNHIAGFNNGGWFAFSNNGLNGRVNALLEMGSNLYVGGSFSASGDNTITLNNITSFAGGNWSALNENGLNDEVRTLESDGNIVFVGGSFTATYNGQSTLNRIAGYDGMWRRFPYGGLDGNVNALERVDNYLYIGGRFSRLSVIEAPPVYGGIARFNLSSLSSFSEFSTSSKKTNGTANDGWSSLGSNNGNALNEQISSLVADANGNIYAGGYFTATADDAVTNLNQIARYNPTTKTWSPLANNGLNAIVTSLAISGDNLYVGGEFSATADSAVTNLNRIARYNLTTNTWSPLSNNGLNSSINSLAISGGNLYVGGAFTRTSDSAVTNLNRIARYNLTTNTWSPLAFNGLNSSVFALAVSGDDLFAGGFFTGTFSFSGINLNQIARYNTVTNTWSELANSGLSDYTESLAVSGNFLYVNGEFFSTADTAVTLNGVARYDTQNNIWAMITGDTDDRGASRRTRAIVQSGNELYVGGSFHGTGGGVAHFFTRIYLQQWNVPAPTSDWFDDSNWILGSVPAFNTNAVIPAGAGNINITSADVTLDDLNFNGGTLTIGAGRTLTINGILGLNGGTIKGDGTLIITNCKPDGIMGGDATAYIQTTLVRCVGENETFNFPVGTVNGYSPVTVKNITGTGNISVKANQGAYSNPANGLPANRLGRWWQIENPGGGVTNANLHFGYLDGDITGNENNYRAFRITGGTASYINSSINTFSNIASMENVTGFSDWTLAELAPTAANVEIGGRVISPNGIGIGRVTITITDQTGAVRFATTNNFGYYRFNNITAGATYVLSAKSKQYQFANNPQVIFVDDARKDLDIVAIE